MYRKQTYYLVLGVSLVMFFITACTEEEDMACREPQIISYDPERGRPGDTILVRGCGFDPNAQNNQIFVNGVSAQIDIGIEEELLIIIPQEATSGPISIQIPGQGEIFGPVFQVVDDPIPPFFYTTLTTVIRGERDTSGNSILTTIVDFDTADFPVQLTSIDIDEENEKVYLLSNSFGNQGIFRMNFDGSGFEILYDSTNSDILSRTPTKIVVDAENSAFYFSDIGAVPSIIKGDSDGEVGLEVIYTINSGTEPLGITLAQDEDYLYWVETNPPAIVKAPKSGLGNVEILYDGNNGGIVRPAEIVIDEEDDLIYFTDLTPREEDEITHKIYQASTTRNLLSLQVILEGANDLVIGPQLGLELVTEEDINNEKYNVLYWGSNESGFNDRQNIIRYRLPVLGKDMPPAPFPAVQNIAGLTDFVFPESQ